MAEIHILDSETINQIAAGEVVERPASVVKELVENAIDAGATAISVEIKDGGISLIRVTDNGIGIEQSQVPAAFSRHATSKIRTVEDLLCVSSLGFRGEALSSIAAVARVELFTKTRDDISGVYYKIEGGEEKEFSETGVPDGTTFVIRNLFYNTPARRKFLKTAATEGSQIQELMVQFALSHPEIAFKFTNQNQVRLQTGGQRRLDEVIYEVCGRDIAKQLLEIEEEKGELTVSGFIGRPVVGRGNRSFEHYFINGRYIKSKIVSAAIEDAYQGFLMQHRYPFVVLHLTLPGRLLDVNVHPSKMELRFQNSREVYEQLKECIRDRLSQAELIQLAAPPESPVKKTVSPSVQAAESTAQEQQSVQAAENTAQEYGTRPYDLNQQRLSTATEKTADYGTVSDSGHANLHDAENVEEPQISTMPEPFEEMALEKYQQQEQTRVRTMREEDRYEAEQMELFDDHFMSKKAADSMRLVGQVFSTYWIVEYKQQMFIIDQHAAHEKVLYERMVQELKEKTMTSQQVSPPIVLTLTAAEEEKLAQYQEYFERLGYSISSFGGMDYAISAVPGNLYGLMEKDLFIQLLDELEPETGRNNENVILEKLASMSCKAAVKGGMQLSVPEAQALLEELLSLDNPYHCPHGRPVIISMTKRDLEKKFKRIV